MCPGFLNFFCDLLFVSISLWHFEAGHNNLVLQHIINRNLYDILDWSQISESSQNDTALCFAVIFKCWCNL